MTAMLDLALHAGNGPVALACVSERQKISLSYLEQLFGKLRRGSLVTSVRGPGGGYNLARPTDQLSVADIIIAVEEPIDSRQCEGKENCAGDKRCMTHDLWESLNETVISHLSGINLADLVARERAKPASGATSIVTLSGSRAKQRAAGSTSVNA